MGSALIIGNTSGIGLAMTSELLRRDWRVAGISKSMSDITEGAYSHFVADVEDGAYPLLLQSVLEGMGSVDCCIYCTGVGERLDLSGMEADIRIFNVNLMGMVKTVSRVIPWMAREGKGHFMGLSSVADSLLSPEAPAYHASKAAFSSYLESLSLALRPKGIDVTNVRFGFVDTKMAKGGKKPFMMDVDRAVRHLLRCIQKRPMRYTAPRIVIPMVWFRDRMLRLRRTVS